MEAGQREEAGQLQLRRISQRIVAQQIVLIIRIRDHGATDAVFIDVLEHQLLAFAQRQAAFVGIVHTAPPISTISLIICCAA